MNHQFQSQLLADEIKPGLVLFLLPSYLEHVGAKCSLCWHDATQGEHYFVCLDSESETSLWVPTSSKPRSDRYVLRPTDKSGHSRWRSRASYCVVNQLWKIPNDELPGSMFCDQTISSQRNIVREVALCWLQHETAELQHEISGHAAL